MNTHHNKQYYTAAGHFAKDHAIFFNDKQIRQSRFFLISIFGMMILVIIFSMNANAQTDKNLGGAKWEQKTNGKAISQKERMDSTQEKQSGNLFEYVSVAVVGQTNSAQPFILESLPVVFTTAETLPVLAASAEQWNKLLQSYGASVVDTKSALQPNQVMVSYLVDATGKMYDVQVLKAANQQLGQQAIALMKATGISKPAFAQGQLVAFRGALILHFDE